MSGGGSACRWTGASSTRLSPTGRGGRARRASCTFSHRATHTRRRPRPSGTWTSSPPSRRPSWKTASEGAYHRIGFAKEPTTTARSTSRRPVPSCFPHVWRSSAIPTTTGTGAGRHLRRDSSLLRPRAGPRPPLADAEKGSGIAMICTFGDPPTSVVEGARSAGATVIGRDGPPQEVPWEHPGWASIDPAAAATGVFGGRGRIS